MALYNLQNKSDFKVKRSNSGLGLFANKKIEQGTFIAEYTGELISTQEADKRGGRYLFRIDSKWAVDGKSRKNIARYINHCCKPNCEVIINRKMVLIYALRNIAEGEEINYDYGKEYFLTYIKPRGCRCPYCRAKNFLNN